MISVPVGEVTGHTSSSAWSIQSVKHRGPFVLSHWYRSRIVILEYITNSVIVPKTMCQIGRFFHLFWFWFCFCFLVKEGQGYFEGVDLNKNWQT